MANRDNVFDKTVQRLQCAYCDYCHESKNMVYNHLVKCHLDTELAVYDEPTDPKEDLQQRERSKILIKFY